MLTEHERRVVVDFVGRRKLPVAMSVTVGLLGVALLLMVAVPQWIAVVTSTLCGGLLGSWVEKKHLHDLSGAVRKLYEIENPWEKRPEL